MKIFDGSEVLKGFAKIAEDKGLLTQNHNPEDKEFVGNPKENKPAKDFRRYEPTEEYNVTKDLKDITEEAHKEPMKASPAQHDRGLVRNNKEKQEETLGFVTKMPTGALVGPTAPVMKKLMDVANMLDDKGREKVANRVNQSMEKIADLLAPKKKDLIVKEAYLGWILMLAPLAISWFKGRPTTSYGKQTLKSPGKVGLAAGLIGGLLTFSKQFLSLQEDLKKDLADLVEILDEFSYESQTATKMHELLVEAQTKLNSVDLSGASISDDPKKSRRQAKMQYDKHIVVLGQISKDLDMVKKSMPLMDNEIEKGNWLTRRFTGIARIESKLDDALTSLNEAKSNLKKAVKAGLLAETQAVRALKKQKDQSLLGKTVDTGKDMVSSVQNWLKKKFSSDSRLVKVAQVEITGVMDENTVAALRQLEERFNKSLGHILKKENPFTGKLVSLDNKLLATPEMLDKLMYLESKKGV